MHGKDQFSMAINLLDFEISELGQTASQMILLLFESIFLARFVMSSVFFKVQSLLGFELL